MIGKTILGGKTQSTSTNKDYVGGCCNDSYEIENNFISETRDVIIEEDRVAPQSDEDVFE